MVAPEHAFAQGEHRTELRLRLLHAAELRERVAEIVAHGRDVVASCSAPSAQRGPSASGQIAATPGNATAAANSAMKRDREQLERDVAIELAIVRAMDRATATAADPVAHGVATGDEQPTCIAEQPNA